MTTIINLMGGNHFSSVCNIDTWMLFHLVPSYHLSVTLLSPITLSSINQKSKQKKKIIMIAIYLFFFFSTLFTLAQLSKNETKVIQFKLISLHYSCDWSVEIPDQHMNHIFFFVFLFSSLSIWSLHCQFIERFDEVVKLLCTREDFYWRWVTDEAYAVIPMVT